MSAVINAIETEYKGYRFRSRLEARWAVFFDAMGIKWLYETQGFEAAGFRYLPDFLLPDWGTWVEVKGDPEGVRKKSASLSRFLLAGGLPNFLGSDAGSITHPDGLLLLGAIPEQTATLVFHPLLQHSAALGISRAWGAFLRLPAENSSILAVEQARGMAGQMMGLNAIGHMESEPDNPGWVVESRTSRIAFGISREQEYAAARKARFEHGECGAPR